MSRTTELVPLATIVPPLNHEVAAGFDAVVAGEPVRVRAVLERTVVVEHANAERSVVRKEPWSSETPGSTRESVWATPSKVLWLSLRTITRQWAPRRFPGSPTRGSSIVSDIGAEDSHSRPAAAWP